MRPLARKALEAIRNQGGKTVNMDLIESTLKEIGKEYRPGLIRWIREQPDRWAKLLDLESRINQAALKRDVEALKETLSQYKGFIVNMVGIFKTPKRETKNLFNLN